ncbi:MAG TPA: replication initiator [Actinomycetes bacterium]|nr:replication initiator [Actinomycetes bacterium]
MAFPTVVLDDLLGRAADPDGFERWMRQVETAGYCARPVRLVGQVAEVDRETGEVRETFSTDDEPDGRLLKACGNRRSSRCRSCSEVYRSDAWQLIAAGLRGGKGLPETVADHPRVFVTFTAPSFGPVHARREHQGRALPCRPRGPLVRCQHGQPVGCWAKHEPDDPALGTPLCRGCFNYEAAVLWNALAPELWRRTTIYLRRVLARRAGAGVRLAFAKVAEYQQRGAIHFHAVIRLDDAERMAPPPAPCTAELLAQAIRDAATAVAVRLPATPRAPARSVGWGEQLDIRCIGTNPGDLTSPPVEAVAAYIAKYATKATEGFGPALDRRLTTRDLDHLDVNEHIAELVRTCWRLGAEVSLEPLRLRQWAHMLGFRGHWSTKSRRYSTTFTALRRARLEHATRERRDPWGRPAAEGATVTLAEWRYAGRGYRTLADAWLAASAAARAREQRRIAREELRAVARAA